MRGKANPNTRIAVRLGAAAVLMFGFGFALVPLYEVFCDITGLNGKNFGRGEVAAMETDRSRTVKVQFVSINPEEMPWDFKPVERTMRVFPGETKQTAYRATNSTSQWMVAQAVPSVTPAEAAAYLTKINCFCFERQPLEAGESQDLPMVFVVSPDLPAHISTITVSYALYNITDAERLAAHDKIKAGSQPL